MIELWRGNANAWECDELGHMNVRFYLAKAMEALGNLADKAGLNGVYLQDATATLIPRRSTSSFSPRPAPALRSTFAAAWARSETVELNSSC